MKMINLKELGGSASEITRPEMEEAMRRCVEQVRKNLTAFGTRFPGAASRSQLYALTDNDDWTNGFYTGQLWLCYETTGEICFKEAAISQVHDFYRRIQERVVVDHHDMGFLYSPSCVAAYRILGGEEDQFGKTIWECQSDREARDTALKAALLAADNLLSRFREKGQFFQAWGKPGDPAEYRMIIDCLLNMPLLFWASDAGWDQKYADKARAHIRTAMKVLIRPDFSTYHTYYFDPETGEPLRGATRQGNRDGSIWARGQAWGIYGSALSYEKMGETEFLNIFEGVVNCFLEHLPGDLVPYWDFDFQDGSGEPRDSSAGAVAACGLLEMAKHVDADSASACIHTAKCLMKALTEHCLVKAEDQSNGILLHGTYAKHTEYNGVTESGVDECTLWGDYFYMEALMRLLTDWNMYW